METIEQVIPFTAWQQAVFVAMFVVFVVLLLSWFTKQSDKWQAFIMEIDEKWRAFSRTQREENNCAMNDVEKSLKDLTTVTQALVAEIKEMRADSIEFYRGFNIHDAQAKEILDELKSHTTVSRRRKPAEKESI